VLKIDKTALTPVTFGDAAPWPWRDGVRLGNPLGELTYTMTRGMDSALDREIATPRCRGQHDGHHHHEYVQIDGHAVNSGNSGGPVYNSRGEVGGMVSAKYAASGV
jgi:serine protease Do